LASSSAVVSRNEDNRSTPSASLGQVGRNPLQVICKSMAPLRIAPLFYGLRRIGNKKSGQ
jgi:hypothetical protein